MIRGIERRKIFKDDKDRENLVERLSIVRGTGVDRLLPKSIQDPVEVG
jgi:hypothetical protein